MEKVADNQQERRRHAMPWHGFRSVLSSGIYTIYLKNFLGGLDIDRYIGGKIQETEDELLLYEFTVLWETFSLHYNRLSVSEMITHVVPSLPGSS